MSEDMHEQMFGTDSFTNEITNAKEAESAYKYFIHNFTNFRSQMSSEGKSYEEITKTIRQCWTNLIQSAKRVGYSNPHLEEIAKLYKIK